MAWFNKKTKRIESVPPEERVVKTENVFVKCEGCEAHLYKGELEAGLQVCNHCGHHFRIGARERLAMLFDDNKYEELDAEVISIDPLKFVDSKPYSTRLKQAKGSSGLPEAIINESVKAFSVDPTSLSGYSTLGPPSGKYIAPADNVDCIETIRGYGDCGLRSVVFTGPFQNDQQHRIVLRAMAETLEGNLQRTLREDLGGTYGVSVSPDFQQSPTPMYRVTIAFACDPARLDSLVSALFRDENGCVVAGQPRSTARRGDGMSSGVSVRQNHVQIDERRFP